LRGRILSQSRTQDVRVIATFIATGNNLEIVGDTASRIILLRQDRSFKRARFSPEKNEWLQMLSREIIQYRAALLTVLRWGYTHREELKATKSELPPFRFQQWNEAVRCLIVAAGRHGAEWTDGRRLTDPVAATATHNVDIQADQILSILRALEGVFGGNVFSVQDIVAVAKKVQRSEAEEKLVSALELMDNPSPKRIAYKLADLRGIVIDDLKLAHIGRDAHTKVHIYRIERNPESDDDGSTPPTTPAPATPTPDGPTGGPTDDGGPRTEPEPGSHAEHAAGTAGEATAEPVAEVTTEAEADTETNTQFLTELDENLRREITEARFLALDTETTGLYPHSRPLAPTTSTTIGKYSVA